MMLVQYGEDTDEAEGAVKKGGEVKVTGEVEKAENREDDGDRRKEFQSHRRH